MRLIDRDALLAAFDAAHKGPSGGVRKLIEQAPIVDAVPVVHGRWKATKAGGPNYPFWDSRCSECGYTTSIVTRKWNYCPVCGAKMDLEGTDADKT